MQKQTAGSVRTAEGRRQLGTRTARDTQHEDRVDDTLARYYRAAGRAERIRVAARRKAARVTATARRKADAITSAAERAASVPDTEAHAALRDLHHLVAGKAEVADLCGLTVKAVTDILATPPRESAPAIGRPEAEAGESGTTSSSREDSDDHGER